MSASNSQPVALVTGASRGIGLAILRRLAADGFEAHGTATTEKGAGRISEQLKTAGNGGAGHIYQATQTGAQDTLTNAVPSVDALVCNAGITQDMLAMRMSDEAFAQVLDVNLTAPFRLIKHYLRPLLKKRAGSIVVISSVVAASGNPGQANYAASKAGLEGMVRSLAKEVGSRGITVNAVAPGFIETDMTAQALTGSVKDALLGQIALGRIGMPEEVAAAVAFLVSPQARYVTGATLPVNGGLHMR